MGLLWFRRSRREDAKHDPKPEPAPGAPAGGPRVALRVRGLLLLNLQPADDSEGIETAPPLGSRDVVLAAMQTLVTGIEFDEAGRGVLATRDDSITIDLGPEDPVRAAVAAAEGDAGVGMLRTIVRSQGWRIYAPRAGVFIEPDALELFARSDAPPSPGLA